LGFDFKFVDAREILLLDPEALRVGTDFIERDGLVAEQDGRRRGGGGGER
jgi:hypothetical protein